MTRNQSKRPKTFLISLCTIIKDEAPYIIEWIEFFRLQGVDRFIIYDDESSDNVTLLSELYDEVYPGGCVGRRNQSVNFQHCVNTFGEDSEWKLIEDVDEFIFSPEYGTHWDMLHQLPILERKMERLVDVIQAGCTRFSTFTSNITQEERRFQYKLERDPHGKVRYRTGCDLQQITSHVYLGPDVRLSAFEEPLAVSLSTGLRIRRLRLGRLHARTRKVHVPAGGAADGGRT